MNKAVIVPFTDSEFHNRDVVVPSLLTPQIVSIVYMRSFKDI